jgi:hypothetical protein
MADSPLISEEYRRMQEELHRNPNYGIASVQYAPLVASVLKSYGVTEFLDYGAGKGRLAFAVENRLDVPLTVHHYEPAIREWASPPQPCRFVTCIDVLEHIEPGRLDDVLDDLKRVVAERGLFTVHTEPADKMLPDGRNAHLIQQPPEWWLPRFLERFDIVDFKRMKLGFYVIVERKADTQGTS